MDFQVAEEEAISNGRRARFSDNRGSLGWSCSWGMAARFPQGSRSADGKHVLAGS
jgi:hypothetical protein